MANRYWDERKERKLPTPPLPPKSSSGSSAKKRYDKENPPPYPGAGGPKMRDLNSGAKFPRVKDAVKKDY